MWELLSEDVAECVFSVKALAQMWQHFQLKWGFCKLFSGTFRGEKRGTKASKDDTSSYCVDSGYVVVTSEPTRWREENCFVYYPVNTDVF